MKILEIGTYVVPAYAGMILREQGHDVTKWIGLRSDPVQELKHGDELWSWLNYGKRLIDMHASYIRRVEPDHVDAVIDNVRAETWARWNVDPGNEAERLGVPWVSMRDDFDGRGFDAVAQARAWGNHLGCVPVYLGDTAGGLWLAFKTLSMLTTGEIGHRVIRQGAALAKLVEGELLVTPERDGRDSPWDAPGTYGKTPHGVRVEYRGVTITEPFRDDAWRRAHLRHAGGRYLI